MSEYYVHREMTPEVVEDADPGLMRAVLVNLIARWRSEVEGRGATPAGNPMIQLTVRGQVIQSKETWKEQDNG